MIIGREGGDIEDGSVISKKEAGGGGAAAATVSSSSSWSRLKDPRIVRVSRAFGGKDRHSKVCTVRGLRDRRVRLSVPTAIQLYDLQDRLGLNQPSKVVDWLLNAAKHEIDELPPLQMPPNSNSNSSSSGSFLTHHHHTFQPFMLPSNNSHPHPPQQLQRPMKITNWDGDGDNDNSILRTKAKVEEEEEEEEDDDDSATRESNLHEEEDNNNNNNRNSLGNNNRNTGFINISPSNNFFSSRNSSNGGLGLLNSISSSAHHHESQQQQQQQPTYSSMMRWDPSTLSLSQSHPAVTDDFHSNFNVLQQHHQVLVYQPAPAGGIAAGHSYYANDQYEPKQINFQMLMSSSSTNSNSLTQPPNEGRPFHSTTNFLPTGQKDDRK